MRGPRLTISGMLAVVGLLALGMAALFSAAPFWISLAAATTLALLLSMVLGVIFLRGGERAYCLGFVLFGVVYLVLVEWDWIGGQLGHDLALALGKLADRVYPDPMISSPAPVLTQLPLEDAPRQADEDRQFRRGGSNARRPHLRTAGRLHGRLHGQTARPGPSGWPELNDFMNGTPASKRRRPAQTCRPRSY